MRALTRASAHLVLFVALVLVSTSGPFLHQADMDAYAMVLLRMGLSAPLFLLWAWATGGLRVPPRHLRQLVGGGLLMAAHFLLWVKAFDLTDYASNLLLLVVQPIFAVLLGTWLGERHGRRTWASIGLAAAGLAIIARGDFSLGPRALVGDAMCVAADLAIALFYVVARDARRELPLPTFMGVTFGIGALAAAPVVWIASSPLAGYSGEAWLWLAAIVLATTLGGHGLMNLAARHVPLFTLNIVIVLEPAIGILLGALLFGASVTVAQVAGGLLLGVAVIVALAPAGAARTSR